jgi:hypothetical protein
MALRFQLAAKLITVTAVTVVLLGASPKSNVTDYFCVKSMRTYRGVALNNLSRFASDEVISVHVTSNTPSVTSVKMGLLVQAITNGLAFWIRACQSCSGAGIQALVVNGKTYLRDDVRFALERTALTPSSGGIPQLDSPVHYDQEIGRGSVGIGARTPMPTFNVAGANDPALQRLCRENRDGLTPILKPLANELCDLNDTDNQVDLNVVLSDGDTPCGLPSRTIACAIPDKSVLLNVTTFTFAFEDGRSLVSEVSGQQEVDGQLVFLHEAGHWLGLPHASADSTNEVMGSIYSDDMCLQDAELLRMREAIDAGWEGRLTSPHALLMPE